MDSVIIKVLAIVVLVLLAIVGFQRVHILKQQHQIDTLTAKAAADRAIVAQALVVDSALTKIIDDERSRAIALRHALDSLTNKLNHAPALPARPVTAPALRDAILRAVKATP
jgi:uncharacterized membrane protein affecting hemolysin expression